VGELLAAKVSTVCRVSTVSKFEKWQLNEIFYTPVPTVRVP
jgi:hypothetical protein